MKLSYLALSVCALTVFATAQQADKTLMPVTKGTNPKLQAPSTKGTTTKNVVPNVPTRASQSGSQLLASTGTDSCTTPDLLVGTGTFLVDTTTATTGVEGQAEPLCNFFATTAIEEDVWFTWVAPSSGTALIDLCPYTAADSRVAVYDGNTCPGAAAIACNDDVCGFTSTVSFVAVSGQSYTFQFGTFPGATPAYSASFDLSVASGVPEDNCATPSVLVGPGPYAHNSIASTTGVEGQTEAPCLFFGSTAIDNDNWYTWTSVTGGVATVSFCGVTGSADSKVAVYPGTGCPLAGTALACDDDACAAGPLESTLTFVAVAGNSYTIQAGSFPGAAGYAGNFTIVETAALPEDSCATPLALVGVGPYPYDNTAASTGVEGQTEALCGPAPLGISNDLWYEWTAPFTGLARATTCLLSTADTKMAAYPSGACPVAGSALACNDDTCNLQSEITFSVTSGTVYLIQVGNFPGGLPQPGAFDIAQFIPLPEDSCATPIAVVGPGPHAFDNTIATNGVEGQAEAECEYYGLTGVNRDVWYTWVAPSTGKFDLSTLGLTTNDSKIAVYNGSGCPAGPAIACGDDACGTGFQSACTFNAVSGNSYTFQIGSFPGVGSTAGPGAFTVTPNATPDTGCSYDDGAPNNAFRAVQGVVLPSTGWIQRHGQLSTTTGVFGVEAVWGGLAGTGIPAGSPAEIVLLDDPNDDGNPSDAVVVEVLAVTTANEGTATYNTYLFATPHVMTGYFFIGAGLAHTTTPAVFPAPYDINSCVLDQPLRSYIVGDATGTINWASLTSNSLLADIGHYSDVVGSSWLIRGLCQTNPGTELCSNGTLSVDHTTPCPCGNVGTDPAAGCAHSFSAAGARISASGLTQLDATPNSAGQVVLKSTNTPAAAFTLFMQHTNTVGESVFHDGVICFQGNLLRLRGRNAGVSGGQPAGQAIFPNNAFANDSTLTLSIRGGVIIGSGATRYYAGWYRNASTTFCPPATANVTNQQQIIW